MRRANCTRNLWRCLRLPLAAATGLLLSACPIQLDPSMVRQVTDSLPPTIIIFSPIDGSSYAASVLVAGTVTDLTNESGDIGGIRRVTYTIVPETLPGGIVDVAGDGSFSFSFPTTGFSGSMVVRVSAEDWNSNVREVSISLVDGGAFATLTAIPGNNEVELTWDDVALANSYSVYNLRYGEAEHDVTSPYTWEGLTNGKLYSFQVKATSSSGDDNWSEIEDVIPLADESLAPQVEGRYRGIFVEWPPIPAADEYILLRSTDPGGPFSIRTITSDSSFLDNSVILGQPYFYRVRPYSQEHTESIINGTEPSPLPPERWHIVDTLTLAGSASAVTIVGDRAYVAAYTEGLQIVDISEPANMSFVASADTSPGGSQDVAVWNERAFLVGYFTDLDVIDLLDPLLPMISTHWDSAWGRPYAIDVSNNHAYVAAGSGHGLQIFDVSGSAPFGAPTESGYVGGASDVDVSGNFAYVTDTCSGPACGLHIIDVLDSPAYPEIGSRPLPGFATGVVVVNGLAYVADGDEGLQIVNTTSPYLVVGSQDTSSAAHVAVSGNYAYIADSSDGLVVVDISDPTTPAIVGSRQTLGTPAEVAVSGSYAFVADESSGLHAIDVSMPVLPIVKEKLGIAGAGTVAVSGSLAFVGGDEGLSVIDLSKPLLPMLGTRPVPREEDPSESYTVRGVAVYGNRVFAAAEEGGLVVCDATDPTLPVLGTADTPDWAWDVAFAGSYALVPDGDNGLQIVDISDPTYPIIGIINTPGEEMGVATAGNYAYLANGEDLVIIDMTDPAFPIVGSVSTGGFTFQVAVRGDRAYVVEEDYGVRVFDVSDPTNPVDVDVTNTGTQFPGSSQIEAITLVGAYALVAHRDQGVQILDISDPDNGNPPIVGVRDTPGSAYEVVTSGRWAYVADTTGLQILDLLGQ